MFTFILLLAVPLISAWLATHQLARWAEPGGGHTFLGYVFLAGAHLVIGVLMSFATLIVAEMLGAFSRSPDSGMAAGVSMAFFGIPALLFSCLIELAFLSTRKRGG